MRDGHRVVVAVLVVLVGLAAGVAAGAGTIVDGTAHQQAGPAPGAAVQSSVDPDVVVMRASVTDDGTGEWSVAYRTRLDDENATAAFESLQDEIAANESAFTDRFATGMERTVESAQNRTGREMTLRNVTVEATTEQLGQEYGVVTYRFTWTNFAAVEDGTIRVGDALSGLFLDGETTLVVAYPEGYTVESATPEPSETRTTEVVWQGQLDFGPNQPRLVLASGGTGGTSGDTGPLVGVVALVVLAVGGLGWYLLRGRSRPAGDGDEAAAGDGAATAGTGGAEEPPEELLSNEERVLRLLEDNSGRIKQQRIAEQFDWTDAKTSQVVGSLREDDAVETFRIGRENVVTLPEESDL